MKPLKIHLESETVLDLFGATRNSLDADLADIAVESPHTAYDIVRLTMLVLADEQDAAMHGGEPIARKQIEDYMPAPITETTEVTVFAIEMPDGPGPEHRTLTRESSAVLSFVVEPLTEL